ncbi:hypothetical protein DFH27DRAFT_645048 [Peziza echinospora]|nr:hypothetical protein DFH27DRAFT_645048 [Peziza echinospora]
MSRETYRPHLVIDNSINMSHTAETTMPRGLNRPPPTKEELEALHLCPNPPMVPKAADALSLTPTSTLEDTPPRIPTPPHRSRVKNPLDHLLNGTNPPLLSNEEIYNLEITCRDQADTIRALNRRIVQMSIFEERCKDQVQIIAELGSLNRRMQAEIALLAGRGDFELELCRQKLREAWFGPPEWHRGLQAYSARTGIPEEQLRPPVPLGVVYYYIERAPDQFGMGERMWVERMRWNGRGLWKRLFGSFGVQGAGNRVEMPAWSGAALDLGAMADRANAGQSADAPHQTRKAAVTMYPLNGRFSPPPTPQPTNPLPVPPTPINTSHIRMPIPSARDPEEFDDPIAAKKRVQVTDRKPSFFKNVKKFFRGATKAGKKTASPMSQKPAASPFARMIPGLCAPPAAASAPSADQAAQPSSQNATSFFSSIGFPSSAPKNPNNLSEPRAPITPEQQRAGPPVCPGAPKKQRKQRKPRTDNVNRPHEGRENKARPKRRMTGGEIQDWIGTQLLGFDRRGI